MATKSRAFTLPENFHATERGNIWLANYEESDHAIYIRLAGNLRLEIMISTENYPGLNVSTLVATDRQLAAHIKKKFAGWTIRKLNLKGIPWVDALKADTISE